MTSNHPNLWSLLHELRAANIQYDLAQHRDEAVMVKVVAPGERWEIEFMKDGTVEAEVFKSDGSIRDASAIQELLARHSG